MKLENQVSNLELSKRLKELGVKQKSYFHWSEHNHHFQVYIGMPDDLRTTDFSAFTVAELGEMLPQGFCSGRKFGDWLWECFPIFDAMTTEEESSDQIKFQKVPEDLEHNEADARAKMLIFLIENKLVKP